MLLPKMSASWGLLVILSLCFNNKLRTLSSIFSVYISAFHLQLFMIVSINLDTQYCLNQLMGLCFDIWVCYFLTHCIAWDKAQQCISLYKPGSSGITALIEILHVYQSSLIQLHYTHKIVTYESDCKHSGVHLRVVVSSMGDIHYFPLVYW